MKELKEMLNSKDHHSIRTIKRWCRNNNVSLYSDNGSNKLYVFREEFELVYNKNSGTFKNQTETRNSPLCFNSNYNQSQKAKSTEYKPLGEIEKQFLSILQSVKTAL